MPDLDSMSVRDVTADQLEAERVHDRISLCWRNRFVRVAAEPVVDVVQIVHAAVLRG